MSDSILLHDLSWNATLINHNNIRIPHYSFHIIMTRTQFNEEEVRIIEFWRSIDAFQKSLKLSEGRPEYFFYDGLQSLFSSSSQNLFSL